METNFKIRDSLKIQIVHELIEPFYLDDIKSMIRGKKYWKLSGQMFETFSKVLVAIGGIISFSSGYFNDPILSFLAGSISTLSLATLQFSSFAYLENKKQGQDLNVLLKKLNLDVIPVLERRERGGAESLCPPSIHLERRPSEIIVEDQVIIPIQLPFVETPIKNLPPPPSADEGLIISEFIPTTDLKEHRSVI